MTKLRRRRGREPSEEVSGRRGCQLSPVCGADHQSSRAMHQACRRAGGRSAKCESLGGRGPKGTGGKESGVVVQGSLKLVFVKKQAKSNRMYSWRGSNGFEHFPPKMGDGSMFVR